MSGQTDFGICKGCGREIVWLTMASGRPMPADPGNVTILVDRGDGRYRTIRGYQSHFATCPKSEELRKRGDASAGTTGTTR